MLTQLLIKLKRSAPGFWSTIEQTNGWLFGLRYKGILDVADKILSQTNHPNFCFSLVNSDDVSQLSSMMTSMPKEHLKHFSPHQFDRSTFKRMLSNPSFILMKAQDRDSGTFCGYFFLRGFVVGRAFHGLVVLPQFTNHGLGTEMWRLGGEICKSIGIDMYATISKDNLPSLVSINKALAVHKVKDMNNNYMLMRCQAKTVSQISDYNTIELDNQISLIVNENI